MGRPLSKAAGWVNNKIVHPVEGGVKKVWGGITGAAHKIDRGTGGFLGKAYNFADQNKAVLATLGPYGKGAAAGLSAVDMAKTIGTNPKGAMSGYLRQKRNAMTQSPGLSSSTVNPSHPGPHSSINPDITNMN